MRKLVLLGSVLFAVSACADELIIGNAHVDASASDAGAVVDAANPPLDAAVAAATDASVEALDGGDIGQDSATVADAAGPSSVLDAGEATLIAASRALGGKGWASPESWTGAFVGPQYIVLAFFPAADAPMGTFTAWCPGGCFLAESKDGGTGGGRGSGVRTDTFGGSYKLYHLTSAGVVLGALYTDDGGNLPLQFAWADSPVAHLEEILIDWLFPRIPFRPVP